MNADLSQLLKQDGLTLEQKLAAIDAAVLARQTNQSAGDDSQSGSSASNNLGAIVDPQDALMCESCQ